MTRHPNRWLEKPLTDHQTQILRHHIAGWNSKAICAKFNLTYSTLQSTLSEIQTKFNAPDRRTMTMLALYDGLFTLEELLLLTIAAMNTQFLADLPERTTGGPLGAATLDS